MRVSYLAALAAAVVMFTVGCGAGSTPPDQAGTTPTTIIVPSATGQPTPGPTATVSETLRFSATTVDGKSFEGASLAGKPAVLWFWASWCPKCRGDAANVRDLQQQLTGKVNVVGVAGLGSGGDGMRKFVADYQLSGFPQLADDSGAVWKRFEVPSQHYAVVLDSTGKVVHRGPLNLTQLKQLVGGTS
ncbi:MAG TPA: redoxin [Micromonosporaceae bacterium]|nr:redoxin [Micromonosporaceae bacterium]HCU51517.1 redoxin [Micromonosporaceae bacterium]